MYSDVFGSFTSCITNGTLFCAILQAAGTLGGWDQPHLRHAGAGWTLYSARLIMCVHVCSPYVHRALLVGFGAGLPVSLLDYLSGAFRLAQLRGGRGERR